MYIRIIFILWIITVTFSLCFLLTGCSNKTEVPAKIKHEGTIQQIITIELVIPQEITQLYNDICKEEFKEEEEIASCYKNKQEDYLNSLLNLVKQFQNTVITGGSI